MDNRIHQFIDCHADHIMAAPTDTGMVYTMLSERPVREELRNIGVNYNSFTLRDEYHAWNGQRVIQFTTEDELGQEYHENGNVALAEPPIVGTMPQPDDTYQHDPDNPQHSTGEFHDVPGMHQPVDESDVVPPVISDPTNKGTHRRPDHTGDSEHDDRIL